MSSGGGQTYGPCVICKDKATGNHYGTMSCDGCKGFFRRTIRKQRRYECRFSGNCDISRDRRNSCRHCRYIACINSGMLPNAVQQERDQIGKLTRRKNCNFTAAAATQHDAGSDCVQDCHSINSSMNVSSSAMDIISNCVGMSEQQWQQHQQKQLFVSENLEPKLLQQLVQTITTNELAANANNSGEQQNMYRIQIERLLKAEETFAQLRNSVISRTGNPVLPEMNVKCFKVANLEELQDLIKQQLLLLVSWLKQIPMFAALALSNQVALLRGYSAEYLLFSLAKRSLTFSNCLLLFNEALILLRNGPEYEVSGLMDMNCIVGRILDELVEPMRLIDMDEIEAVCLKAIGFFNPNCCTPASDGYRKIKEKRDLILATLESYVLRKSTNTPGRLGNLFMLLPTLQSIGLQLRESVQLSELFGIMNDALLLQLLGTNHIKSYK